MCIYVYKNVKIYIRALTFIVKSSRELLNEVNTRSNVTDNYTILLVAFISKWASHKSPPHKGTSGEGREENKKVWDGVNNQVKGIKIFKDAGGRVLWYISQDSIFFVQKSPLFIVQVIFYRIIRGYCVRLDWSPIHSYFVHWLVHGVLHIYQTSVFLVSLHTSADSHETDPLLL